jgi:NACHT domain
LTEWMETYSEAWTTRDVEPVPEANFLRSLPDNAFIVILGEPGSGKSWLAANMARTLSGAFLDSGWLERREPMPHAPVFARFRALKASRPGENVSAWDVIEDWSAEFSHPIRPPLPAQHRPVFILDGLDELRIDARASLARSLHDLPGTTILTCRTAVWESELRDKFTPAPTVYRLLGLNDQEQRRFLESRPLPDGTSTSALLQRVRSNPSLRALAGNPLLLGLIAEEGANLPANRAELYASTIRKRWRELEEKRLIDSERTLKPNELLRLEPIRDRFLAKLAEGLVQVSGSDTHKANIRTVFTWLDLNRVAETLGLPEERLNLLVDALLTTGLLTREGETGYAFIHPTFQEHALARAWLFPDGDEQNVSLQSLERRMTEVIQDHWLQVEFEETLALALSMAVYKGVNPLEPIRRLVEQRRISKKTMWIRGRSALRVVLHVLARSSIELKDEFVDFISNKLKTKLQRFIIANDENIPTQVLLNIARDKSAEVRERILKNPNFPEEALIEFINDEDSFVESAAISKINDKKLQTEVGMIEFSTSKNSLIRSEIGRSEHTPPEILVKLVKDDILNVRRSIAGNENATEEILLQIINDEDVHTRQFIASNLSATEAVLSFLSADESSMVRSSVARNPNITQAMMVRFSQDQDAHVRNCLSTNSNIPESILLELFQNKDPIIYNWASINPNISEFIMFQIVQNGSSFARRNIAENSNATESILFHLLQDEDERVRRYVAKNINSAESILIKLSRDEDASVRSGVAENPNSTAIILSELSRDEYASVRSIVAGNQNTPGLILLKLTKDRHLNVRDSVAWNPNAVLEDLLWNPQVMIDFSQDSFKEGLWQKVSNRISTFLSQTAKPSLLNWISQMTGRLR